MAESDSEKKLHFVFEWIGPRGPLPNGINPSLTDLADKSHGISVDKSNGKYDRQDSTFNVFKTMVPTTLNSVFSMPEKMFIYEIQLNHKTFFNSYFYNSIGVLDNYVIDPWVLQQIKRGAGKLMLSYPLESFVEDEVFRLMHNYFYALEIPLHNIIYLTNAPNGEQLYHEWCNRNNIEAELNVEYAGLYLSDLMNHASDADYQVPYVVGPRKKLFLNFNRRYRNQRLIFLLKIFNEGLLDRFNMSFSDIHPDSRDSWLGHARNIVNNYNLDITDEQLEILNSMLPLKLDNSDFTRFPMEERMIDTKRFYDDTLVHIVSETNFFERAIHITEKTMKPILFKQPFIILGSQYSLKNLKDMGFKTFSNIWDETYDLEHDPMVRMEKVINVCKYIASVPEKELIKISQKAQPIVEYNFELLKELRGKDAQRFLDKFGE